MGHLVGDVLIAAAFMSYMGPFLSTYREEITLKWMTEVSLSLSSSFHSMQSILLIDLMSCASCPI